MNVHSIAEYKASLAWRYEAVRSRTQASFDETREYTSSAKMPSTCPQAPGAFDYFTMSFNLGAVPHCRECGSQNIPLGKQIDAFEQCDPLEQAEYLEMQRFFGLMSTRARNVLRRAMDRRAARLERLQPAGSSISRLRVLKIALKTAMRRWHSRRHNIESFPDFDISYIPLPPTSLVGENGMPPMPIRSRDIYDGNWVVRERYSDGTLWAMPKFNSSAWLPTEKIPYSSIPVAPHPSQMMTIFGDQKKETKLDLPPNWHKVATNTLPRKRNKLMDELNAGSSKERLGAPRGIQEQMSYREVPGALPYRLCLRDTEYEDPDLCVRGAYEVPYGVVGDYKPALVEDEEDYADDVSEADSDMSITYARKKDDFDYEDVFAQRADSAQEDSDDASEADSKISITYQRKKSDFDYDAIISPRIDSHQDNSDAASDADSEMSITYARKIDNFDYDGVPALTASSSRSPDETTSSFSDAESEMSMTYARKKDDFDL